MKRRDGLKFWMVILGVMVGWGCQQAPQNIPPAPAAVKAPDIDTVTKKPVEESPVSKTPLKDSVTKLLAEAEKEADSPFPKGTRLNSVNLEKGVATLDFSKEFQALADMGDTNESQAQKRLQAALAAFPQVEKMRVTVDGKPFESQATDWNTPFPVRKSRTSAALGAKENKDASHIGSEGDAR